ncbi:UvrD-helicase domain-containing protein [Thalassolituus oleivorans]|uniref:UvrD-helicase domain-containing protein n=1 Tax=Thalassolituus oleivorans TaxID=187493 RepID=UPI0030C84612
MSGVDITDHDIDEFLEDYNQRGLDPFMALEFDEERRTIIKSWHDVQACPGSGKTTIVGVKLLILERKLRSSKSGVCVLTHTNVARNEIISRIESHPSGFRLTQYPNFIGTIQEFINRYLAAPYLRSINMNPVRIDDDASAALMAGRISHATKSFLARNSHASISELKIHHETGEVKVPGFQKESPSPSYRNLMEVFYERINRGYFFYSEMYYFAKKCIQENGEIVSALRKRFSCVLVDEMQDTQKYQDDIINKLFCCDDVRMQRLGDPDQAIFDNMGGDSPNVTFNGNAALTPLKSTHRFPADIAAKISGLSVTGIGRLQSFKRTSHVTPHTIFLYTDATKTSVLERFCELLDVCGIKNQASYTKAVGGTEGLGGFISEYWPDYDKTKSVKTPRPQLLMEAISRKWWATETDAAFQYALLMQCILDLLRRAGVTENVGDYTRHYSSTSLARHLRIVGVYAEFKGLLTSWIMAGTPTQEIWDAQYHELLSLLGINAEERAVKDYLAYSESSGEDNEIAQAGAANVYRSASGREIQVGTIHSVKGETHDATLVLETKNHQYDLEKLSRRLAFMESQTISGKMNQKFARQVYVAASRPRRLLCMAAHQDRISPVVRTQLMQHGWMIQLV